MDSSTEINAIVADPELSGYQPTVEYPGGISQDQMLLNLD